MSTCFNFSHSWSNYTKLLYCDDEDTVLWIRKKIVTSLLRNLTLNNLLCTNPIGFSQCRPLWQCRFVGENTEWSSHAILQPSDWLLVHNAIPQGYNGVYEFQLEEPVVWVLTREDIQVQEQNLTMPQVSFDKKKCCLHENFIELTW